MPSPTPNGAAKYFWTHKRADAQSKLTRVIQDSKKGPAIMSDRLEGKIAVITGGSSVIGLAAPKRFVDEGAYSRDS
jgi:hypothetical protein